MSSPGLDDRSTQRSSQPSAYPKIRGTDGRSSAIIRVRFVSEGFGLHALIKMLRRFSYLSLGILVFAGAWWAAVPRASGAFTDLVPLTVPQRAAADFDADGRPDVAFIEEAH